MIDLDTPYINDSGGNYRDGRCESARTVHFGQPTQEQSAAYTRILQSHIATDSAIFGEGTTDTQLRLLPCKVGGVLVTAHNNVNGTGDGFSSSLNVHERPQSMFDSPITLVPGHVIINEFSFHLPGKWGMRIKSAIAVKRVIIGDEFSGSTWLGFERLTCVPIQTKMVKESMLYKEEKQWLKEHNQRCRELLEPLLKEDKRALKWLRRECASGPLRHIQEFF